MYLTANSKPSDFRLHLLTTPNFPLQSNIKDNVSISNSNNVLKVALLMTYSLQPPIANLYPSKNPGI